MPGKGTAPKSGQALVDRVAALAGSLNLMVSREVRVGRRVWGAQRRIDLVLTGQNNRRLGLECKAQSTAGTAEEKIPATIQDIEAWPIPGLVVFEGEGFSPNMASFLISTGKAVEFSDLENWLRLFFGLSLPEDVDGST